MKKEMFRFVSFFIVMVFITLNGNGQTEDMPKVASKNKDLTVCDYTLLNKTVTIPLSSFVDELQIVKLDNDDRALVSQNETLISDNYILVKGSNQNPYKLFDKKTGKFLTNIGSYGRGPSEYLNVYCAQIDEKHNRIYLLPWQTRQLLVFNLKGEALAPIPLCFEAPKGVFKVVDNSKVIVTILPFQNIESVMYVQDLKGKLLHSHNPAHLKLPMDFSNEVFFSDISNAFSFSIFSFMPRKDSIYNYDIKSDKLNPVYTLDYKGKDLTIHGYSETSKYYFGWLARPKQITESMTTTQDNKSYIIDKNTLKGGFFELKNDYLGGLDVWPSLSGEYFVQNKEPGILIEELNKVLKEGKLSDSVRKKVSTLLKSINENDNNYILYARIKK